MIIAYFDIQQQCIHLFGFNGIQSIPLFQAAYLPQIIGDQQVIYVTNAKLIQSDQILQTLNEHVSGKFQKQNINHEYKPQKNINVSKIKTYQQKNINYQYKLNSIQQALNYNQPVYLRSTRQGALCINDLGITNKQGQIVPYRFQNSMDFVPINKLISLGLQTSQQVRSLINQGILQLVPMSLIDYAKQNHIHTTHGNINKRNTKLQTFKKQQKKSIIGDVDGIDQQYEQERPRRKISSGLDTQGHDDLIEIDQKYILKGGKGRSNESRLAHDINDIPEDAKYMGEN